MKHTPIMNSSGAQIKLDNTAISTILAKNVCDGNTFRQTRLQIDTQSPSPPTLTPALLRPLREDLRITVASQSTLLPPRLTPAFTRPHDRRQIASSISQPPQLTPAYSRLDQIVRSWRQSPSDPTASCLTSGMCNNSNSSAYSMTCSSLAEMEVGLQIDCTTNRYVKSNTSKVQVNK